MLYAIASLIDFDDLPGNRDAWQELQRVFNDADVPLTGLPHLSWHGAEDYQFDLLDLILIAHSQNMNAFTVITTGVGVFSGENPILYLPVTRSPEVSEIHGLLSRQAVDIAGNPNPLYVPDLWVPHVTLTEGAYVDADRICQVVSALAYIPLRFEFVIDHFATIYRDKNVDGVRKRHPFLGVLE